MAKEENIFDLAKNLSTVAVPAGNYADEILDPESIGSYRILERLGEGGFGIVYKAERREPVRQVVALKVIKPGMDSREVLSRFQAERQALAKMNHPAIARILDVGSTEAGRPYFAMELVKGLPITKFCDEMRLRTSDRLELFVKVCDAVGHAHDAGIVHRDLKPSNVLVADHSDGLKVKVIDFGIAKAMDQPLTDATLYTQQGQLLGTPAYMSPEQMDLGSRDIDARTDVYSLGVMLYELLTGSAPFAMKRFQAGGIDAARRIIRDEAPPRPSAYLTSLGEKQNEVAARRGTETKKLAQLVRGELDWIVMKALEKNRSERYATAASLAEDVQRFLRGEAVEAGPPSRLYRMQKLVSCHRREFLLGGVGATALLTGLGVWYGRGPEDVPVEITLNVVGEKKTYNEGELLQFEVQSNVDCYLILVSETPEGEDEILLFPNGGQRDAFIKGGEKVRVPDNGVEISVAPPFGRESVFAIATTEENVFRKFLGEYLDQVPRGDSEFVPMKGKRRALVVAYREEHKGNRLGLR